MKTASLAIAALVLMAISIEVRCQAQRDLDCVPSAQRVFHDLQDNHTFQDDPTMRDIVAWAIDKRSDLSREAGSDIPIHTRAELDAILSLGNAQAQTDRIALKVWDETHDQEKTEEAREVAERVHKEVLAAACAKANILTGDALSEALHSPDLVQARAITNDNYPIWDAEQRTAYHDAWKALSQNQLTRLTSHAESLKPSVAFAIAQADVAAKPDDEMKRSLADLNRIISDVKTEQELRQRQTITK